MGRREPKNEAMETLQNMSSEQVRELGDKLSGDDSAVCEWERRGSTMFRVECESRRRGVEHSVMDPGLISHCPYCKDPIRIVEDSDDG